MNFDFKGKLFLVSLAFAIFVLAYAQNKNADLPKGFIDKQLPFTRAYIIYPSEWILTHNESEKERKFFVSISKENPYTGAKIRTALNILTIQNIPKNFNKTPSQYAANMIEDIKTQTNIVKQWKNNKDKILEQGFIREDKDPSDGEDIKEYFTTFSNDFTGTLYIISFFAPAITWENDWQKAEIMIKHFKIDENF